MEELKVEQQGYAATVTLNRPHKLNAMTKPMWLELGRVFEELSADTSLRCVVLRGAGDKAFSPGNDIAEFETDRSNVEQARAYGHIMAKTLAALKNCQHPTVALIKGICVGGGMEIAGCCDIRICGESSRFGAPIKRLGLVMAYSEINTLLSLVGPSNTAEILYEGQIFGAEKAKAMNIVTRIVADDQVDAEVASTVERICDGAPLVARWHKKFMKRLADPKPLSEEEYDEGFACFGTEDFQTGYKAFLAKQKPEFEGR